MKKRQEILSTLRDVAGQIKIIQKEILSMDVPGLQLVRQDLGIKRTNYKKQKPIHGQMQSQPRINNLITMPGDGQGEYPTGTIPEILYRR